MSVTSEFSNERVETSVVTGDRTAHQTFRPDIQGLRAVAVILVILAHASVPGFEGGYLGVDVFFVISGFVITSLLLRQPPRHVRQNLAYFYARRIRRIVPAATLTLVGTTFAAYFLLGTNFVPQLLGDVRWASLFSANFRLIHTGSNYFIPGVAPSLVTHYWSLAVEEQFYLFFPLVVFSLTWLTPLRSRATSLGLFLAAAIARVGVVLVAPHADQSDGGLLLAVHAVLGDRPRRTGRALARGVGSPHAEPECRAGRRRARRAGRGRLATQRDECLPWSAGLVAVRHHGDTALDRAGQYPGGSLVVALAGDPCATSATSRTRSTCGTTSG